MRIDDGRDRTVTYHNDLNGQTVRRVERDGDTSRGDPHEWWYRFGGREMGYAGNNGRTDVHYAASTAQRTAPSAGTGAFRNGSTTHTPEYDFDTSLTKLNSAYQGSASGTYTVGGGETLQSIAANLWGDAQLWFKLAEANGLTGASALGEGQMLTIPAGVAKNTHNASTFKPYDAAEAIGDTSPTAPKPGSKNKCGAFGAVLLVIVAVAVTIATKGALTKFAAGALKGALGLGAAAVKATAALAPVIGGALAGAAGSIASQGFGVATGLQDRFSWTGVAMAGISGGVGGGLGGAAGGGFVGGAIGGIAGNAMTQGIALATGLQNKFDWAGLAVAGVVGGAIGAMNGHFGNTAAPRSLESYGQQLASGMAGAIAGGAARSLIDGSSFGDNVLAALPDVIGSTIGNMVGHGVSSRGETAMARLRREGGVEYAQNVDSNVRSDHDEIIVTASRSRLAAARRGFFGSIHESLSGVDRFFGRLFRGGSRNSIDTTALVRNISMSIRRAPSATAEFGSGLGHGLYNVGANAVTGLYHLVTTNPLTTIKATGYALAGGIDSILEAENTPARIQLGRAGSALSNASAFDLGYGVGNVGGNIALLVAPELLAGRAGAVGRVGVAEGPLISDVRAISAADVNAPFLAKGWDAPYSYGSQARTFTTSADLDFVRVTTTNPEGAFLVRGKEIAGMSPEQIQVHLALPKVPTNMLDVRVPIGTRMQTGFVGPQPAFGVTTRGGIQYQILDQIPSQSFGPMRPIR